MVHSRDLQGTDASWLACDSIGQVAVLTTAGEGPVPLSALPSTEYGEKFVLLLPETAQPELLTRAQRPDDFLDFAKRGFYAYDWSDVHRPAAQAKHQYELQARPATPVQLIDLPSDLQALASATRFSSVVFGATAFSLGT